VGSRLLILLLPAVRSMVKWVTVTEVAKNPFEGLKRGDMAKIEEIKKSLTQKDSGDAAVTGLLAKTPSFTVAEYLAKYPDSKDLGEDYRIGGYDVLSITVYEEKDLTIESIRVSADGFISFPLIGRLRVADLTTSEAEKIIAKSSPRGLPPGRPCFRHGEQVRGTQILSSRSGEESRQLSPSGQGAGPGRDLQGQRPCY
jgi:hypothetical protein